MLQFKFSGLSWIKDQRPVTFFGTHCDYVFGIHIVCSLSAECRIQSPMRNTPILQTSNSRVWIWHHAVAATRIPSPSNKDSIEEAPKTLHSNRMPRLSSKSNGSWGMDMGSFPDWEWQRERKSHSPYYLFSFTEPTSIASRYSLLFVCCGKLTNKRYCVKRLNPYVFFHHSNMLVRFASLM
jgi:hypothetical protein